MGRSGEDLVWTGAADATTFGRKDGTPGPEIPTGEIRAAADRI